jgi:hypothetical protein
MLGWDMPGEVTTPAKPVNLLLTPTCGGIRASGFPYGQADATDLGTDYFGGRIKLERWRRADIRRMTVPKLCQNPTFSSRSSYL